MKVLNEQGIIHRDLKPQNILLNREQNRLRVKIGSFCVISVCFISYLFFTTSRFRFRPLLGRGGHGGDVVWFANVHGTRSVNESRIRLFGGSVLNRDHCLPVSDRACTFPRHVAPRIARLLRA